METEILMHPRRCGKTMNNSFEIKVRPYKVFYDDGAFIRVDQHRYYTLAVNRDIYLPAEAEKDVDILIDKYYGNITNEDMCRNAEDDFLSLLKRYEHEGKYFVFQKDPHFKAY